MRGFSAFVVLPGHHCAAYRHRAEDGAAPLDQRRAGAREAMQRCHAEMPQAADDAEAAHRDPALALRARILAQAAWVQEHPGLHKVMHESKVGMPFKEVMFTRITAAVQRCMEAGAAPPGDATAVALDLRTAVTGMLSRGSTSPACPGRPSPSKPTGSCPSSSDSRGRPARRQSRRQSSLRAARRAVPLVGVA